MRFKVLRLVLTISFYFRIALRVYSNIRFNSGSNLGSSIGSEAKMAGHSDSGVPPVARSTISFRSFIQNEYGAAVLPPIPAENEEGNRICFICKKILKDVDTESKWRSVIPHTFRS